MFNNKVIIYSLSLGITGMKKRVHIFFFNKRGNKNFWVAAILMSRSERGNKQNFILGLIKSNLFDCSRIHVPDSIIGDNLTTFKRGKG
jgi:hypothetical protein